MTDAEWESICFLVEEWWPPSPAEGDFDEHRRRAWRLALDGFEADAIATAVKALLISGAKWRPRVSEVVAQIRKDPARPSFDEALQLVLVCLRARTAVRKSLWEPGERAKLDDQAALERAEGMHPLIGAFVVRQGGPARLRGLGLDDPENEYREARRHELRLAWDRFVEDTEGRDIAALASGRRGELGQFDPLAALGGRRVEIGAGS